MVRMKDWSAFIRDLPLGPFQNSGFALAQGFYQAMFVTQAGPTLTIDTKCSCFYRNVDMLHFLSIYLGRDITHNGGTMSIEEKRVLMRMKCLETITIETRHTTNKSKEKQQSKRTHQMIFVFY